MVDLENQLTAALAEIDRLDVAGIHTCHSECQKSNCVLRRELTTVTEQRDEAREKVATMVLAGDYNDLFIAKVTGNLAARAEITAVTEQRDRLAKALNMYGWPCSDEELAHHCASACRSSSVEAQREMKRRKALQSLTPNDKDQARP
jgi:hypothetical protein